MATTRIRDKISTLVKNQLPEFIRSDYSLFVTFIEAYYQFLEQDQGALELVQNAKSYNDIDVTAESFVNYFLANYAQNIPHSVLTNKRLIIKRVRDLYESKGSEISFKLLFQLLYNEPVSLSYPYDNVLRASAGTWVQKTTVRVLMSEGSAEDIADRYLDLTKNGLNYRTSITNVKLIITNLYELTLNQNELGPFEVDDVVTVNDGSDIIFEGAISGTTSGHTVLTPGQNFRVAQIFNVNIGGAIGTQLQVLAVDSNGGITKLRIISFGYNFDRDVSVNLYANSSIATVTQGKKSNTLGFVDRIRIIGGYSVGDPNRYFDTNYNTDAVLPYTGNTFGDVSTTTTVSAGAVNTDIDDTIATVYLRLGAIGRFPGAHTTNKGFLSDDVVRLADSKLYQPFAYQTESTLEISTFYDVVQKLIHPAGQKLYNTRVLENSIDVTANVSVVSSSNIFTELRDAFTTLETTSWHLTKPLSDEGTALESKILTFYTDRNDSTSATSDTVILTPGLIKTDTVNVIENVTNRIQKHINPFNLAGTESVALTEDAPSIGFLYNLPTENLAATDAASLLTPNYAEPDYFSEYYAGETTFLT